MLLGFANINIRTGEKAGFVEKILSGDKIHSLRKGKRWKLGMKIHMCTGLRTSKYKQFNEGYDDLERCRSVQEIKLVAETEYLNDYKIFVDGRELPVEEQIQLAHNDGFDSLVAFWQWFNNPAEYPNQIIHWTGKRY